MELPLARRDECPQCGCDAKVCLNCRFYDRSSYHECREPQAEWVKEKDVGTFCSYFSPREDAPAKDDLQDDKAKLEALFKK